MKRGIKFWLVLLIAAAVMQACNTDNPQRPSGDKTDGRSEQLLYEKLGLVDSVCMEEGISENTHVLQLGAISYEGISTLLVKFKYSTSYEPYLWANNVNIYCGIRNVYLSGSLTDTGGYHTINHVIAAGPELEPGITKLRTTVYYGCRVISIRDLQIYKID